MKAHLTKRDLKLFNFLDSFGFLSTTQINQLAFSGVNYRTVLRRLRKLHKLHYLLRSDFYKGGVSSWYLSKRGSTVLGAKPLLNSLNKNTIEHDLKVNDVRIALEQFGCFSGWVSAHYLKQNLGPDASPYSKKVDTIPDWLCITRTWENSKNLALELELSWKGVKRMRYILSKYMEKKTINCLWYIVPTKLFGERLAKVALEYDVLERKGANWFMWSLLDDVLDKTKEATIYTLKETVKPQKIFLMPAHSLAHTVSTHQFLT